MKSNKKKKNFWIDIFLFFGFVISFFMDLTGLSLHQWLGLAVGVLAAYHLIVH